MNYLNLKNIIYLIFISIIFITSYYIGINLASTNFEEILFYSLSLDVIATKVDNKPFFIALKKGIPLAILLFGLLYLLFFSISSKLTNNFALAYISKHKSIIILLLLIITIIYFLKTLDYLTIYTFICKNQAL